MKSEFRVAGLIAASIASIVGAGACSSSAPASYKPEQPFDAGADLPPPSPTDAGAGGAQDAAPMAGTGSIKIIPGRVRFLANGTPCSNDADPKAEIWCAILMPAPESPGMDALYAVNVSQALAGKTLSCLSPITDPNCLLLTRGFAENTTHKASFQGSTLLYHDQAGFGYGWRPGMLNGRRLSSGDQDFHDCVGSKSSDVVACLHDIPFTPIPGSTVGTDAVFSELVAGRVGPGSLPLEVVDNVISSDPADDVTRFQFRILPKGDLLAWSSAAMPQGPEILKVQKVRDPASQRVVASNVSRWLVPSDGAHWIWLKDFNYDSQSPAGTLQIAPFDGDGSTATTLMPKVSNVYLAGNGSLAVLQDNGGQGGGDLSGIVDPVGKPTAITPLDSAVIGVIGASSQGHLAYAKRFDFVFGLIDLHVQKVDGTGEACFLDFREEVPYGAPLTPRFSPNGQDLIWSRVFNLDDPFGALRVAGRVTRVSDCNTQNVTNDIGSLSPLGDEGITFSDSLDNGTGTLHIRQILKDGTLAPGSTVIQTRASASLSLYPFAPAVVYSVNIGDPADGLYIHPVVFPAN
ncbi:MAG TPA: hypothetical protein VHU40_18710 [Polyangia bacterium]|jgi:hypothetical protein|nr:hypothetical protein [Polyangia bacterium]